MKKTIATFIVIVIAVASLHAVRVMQQSYITGKVSPVDAAGVVVAINGTDSIKIKPSDGGFSFIVAPGTWTIWIDAKRPYKSSVIDANVTEGQTTRLGEIKLIQ
ncbi:carboxypeptidase regulatory-like domain-containing protein [Paraflavitalea sp. CAU 1676]|jgi:hypothetical protein|uniref:carboxypeptidase regulatory-like domain-containing protein n=1 Tax=Paraflavitalea sp. CAU 1676 TaxID=3032598 RepID=UPI0023DAB517|nr:carboxypeptidase regulatory-like domain-containing protein [Paraflavitalea sp. CAU 1676]MDF2187873.1 carboxypeptidase regulatory-like domain-containing protein [Paraflavitalea sp. CAU 1676]